MRILPIILTLGLASCAGRDTSYPAQLVYPDGATVNARASIEQSVSDWADFRFYTAEWACNGNYYVVTVNPVIAFPISCSNGVVGSVTATRNIDADTADLVVHLDNGAVSRFRANNMLKFAL